MYRYRAGIGYVMVKKIAETKDFHRVVEEAWLNRVLTLTEPVRGNAGETADSAATMDGGVDEDEGRESPGQGVNSG